MCANNVKILKPKCKNCWDKGYSSVMESIQGFDDFGGDGNKQEIKIYKRYCDCAKGKLMLEAGKKRGERMEFFNLWI